MTVQDVTLHRALMLLLFMKPTMPEDQFYAFPQIALVFSPLIFKEKQREARTNQETLSLHSALCTHICRPACCGMDQLDVPTTVHT